MLMTNRIFAQSKRTDWFKKARFGMFIQVKNIVTQITSPNGSTTETGSIKKNTAVWHNFLFGMKYLIIITKHYVGSSFGIPK